MAKEWKKRAEDRERSKKKKLPTLPDRDVLDAAMDKIGPSYSQRMAEKTALMRPGGDIVLDLEGGVPYYGMSEGYLGTDPRAGLKEIATAVKKRILELLEERERRGEAMNPQDQYRVLMGLDPVENKPSSDADTYRLRIQLEDAKRAVEQQNKTLERLQKAAHLFATVVSVRGQRMTIVTGAQVLDVGALPDVKVGDTVTILPDSMQALAIVKDAPPAATVATVVSPNKDGQVEVNSDGIGRRLAICDVPCDAGDRVLTDPSMSVVFKNLGKPKSLLTFEKATGTTWDDIGGQEDAKRVLRDAIETPVKHRELYTKYGRKPTKGILLEGPPGTGKTLLARASATALAQVHGHEISPGFIYVKGPSLLSKWVGESESSVRAIFAAAREHAKIHGYQALVFLDECEAVLGRRGNDRGALLTQTMVPQFLAEMDGLDDNGPLILLATNRPGDLDPAIVREGRIDHKVKVGRPDREAIERIAQIHLKNRPAASGVSIEELAKSVAALVASEPVGKVVIGPHEVPLRLQAFASGAMVAGIVESASEAALHRDVASGGFSGIRAEDIKAGVKHAIDNLTNIDPSDAVEELIRSSTELLTAAKETPPSVQMN